MLSKRTEACFIGKRMSKHLTESKKSYTLFTIVKTFDREKYPYWNISESRRRWDCGNGKSGEWTREGEPKPFAIG